MTQLASQGRGLPQYDYISDPTTGLVAAQVTLDDGSMFHTPIPCRYSEEASEGAVRAALGPMRLLPVERGSGVGKGRGEQISALGASTVDIIRYRNTVEKQKQQ